MRLRASVILIAITLATVVAAAAVGSKQAATAAPKSEAKSEDRISGEWDVAFTIQGMTVPAKLNLKLDGDKLTGTADSQHTGAGTLSDGKWADNKLSFTLNFASHESIAVTGTLKDDKLTGEFRTEGMQGTWEGTMKKK